MVKAYLKYEQIGGFGVVCSSNVAVHQIPNDNGLPLVAAAAVDILVIWNLRSGVSITRLGNVETRKAGAITALAVSPNGNTIATGYNDGSIRIWEFSMKKSADNVFAEKEPQPIVTFNGHRSGISSLAFEQISSDNKDEMKKSSIQPSVVVSGSNDGDVIMWSITEGSGLFRLPAHNDAITAVIYYKRLGNEYIISGSKDGLVKVYDVPSQHCVQTIVGHRHEVWCMAMDPSKKVLVTGSTDAEIRVFLAQDLVKKKDVTKEMMFVDSEQVFHPIGAVTRQVATDRLGSISFIVKNGDTYLIASGRDKTAEIFQMRPEDKAQAHRRRRRKRREEAIEKEVKEEVTERNLSVEETEKRISEEKSKLMSELSASDYMRTIRALRFPGKLISVSFLANNAYIPVTKATNYNLQLLCQTRESLLEIHRVVFPTKKAKKRKNSSANSTEDAGDSQEKSETEFRRLLRLEFPGHQRDVRSISLAPDETSLLSASDGTLKLWNIATQSCIRTMKVDGSPLCTTLVGPDAKVGVAGFKDGKLHAYDLGSGSLITEEENAHNGDISSICLDNHIYEADTMITGGSDKRVRFWNFEGIMVGKGKLNLERTLEVPDQVLCVRVAHGRKRPTLLVSLMDSTVRAYHLDTLEPYLTFYGHQLPVMSMDVSSDGLMLATGSADKTLKLWGMDFGDLRRNLRAHTETVLSVAFQPNTHYIFSGSRDGTVKYWDGDKFEYICDIEGQKGEAWSLATSNDGEILVSASKDKMIRVWKRTDEPLFLEEEQDRRMDEMFESTLIDEDLAEANKAKKDEGFLKDDTKGEALAAGKRSLDTVKGGEALLEALQLCEEERDRLSEDDNRESANPLLLGLSPNAYMLRTIERIKTADLEEVLHILPLNSAMRLLEFCSELLAPNNRTIALSIEMLVRASLYLIKLHHNQITAGAVSRSLIAKLKGRIEVQLSRQRTQMGFNMAAIHFWKTELIERDDAPFRDANARAHNLQRKKRKKVNSLMNTLQPQRT